MKTQPKHNISTERATDSLKDGQPLIDAYLDGNIRIEISEGWDKWDKEVVMENCIIEHFSGSVTQFEKPVRLINNYFKNCQFVFTYFIGGLIIENCIFDNYLDFQAGGHNKPESPIIIKKNEFKDFVNFFDCWYEGPISVIGNKFYIGTNIASEKQLLTFDFTPKILDNQGQLNIESEFADEKVE